MKTLESYVQTNCIYTGERENWFVVACQHRQSDILTRSNWRVAVGMLGGEGKEVVIERLGHWAVGWIEYMLVAPGSSKIQIAETIEKNLADYPVLDDMDYSNLQFEEANNFWKQISYEERHSYIPNLPKSAAKLSLSTLLRRYDCDDLIDSLTQ